jgi:predicted RNase H-like nuclease (RuvC/YqgF family)
MMDLMIPLITFDFPTVGGATGIFAAVGWTIREGIGWLTRRKDQEITEADHHVSAQSSAVNDAATVNAVMLRNVEALQLENQRLHGINQGLNDRILEKDRTITEMQLQIQKLMGELDTLYDRLDELKSR